MENLYTINTTINVSINNDTKIEDIIKILYNIIENNKNKRIKTANKPFISFNIEDYAVWKMEDK